MQKQVCTRCLYDSSVPRITFYPDGQCNYCKIHDKLVQEYQTDGWEKLKKIASEIKNAGGGKKYDCVVGVSGGCDSSYIAYLAKDILGLRPLAVHWDNTWNSTTAVENIHNVLRKLNIDLYTYVVDNEEINRMYRAFLNASVPEFDAPSDIALATVLYIAAEKYGVKYILEGHCFTTEGVTPFGWMYFDAKYLETICKKFGVKHLKTFPNLWLSRWLKWIVLRRIKKIRPLWYIPYEKESIKKFLTEKLDWKWYGGHHLENKTAYFNNNYIFPRFGIDMRVVEYSALIRSGQMRKEEALKLLKTPLCVSTEVLTEIKKRLKLSDAEFEKIIKLPLRDHTHYKTYHKTFKKMRFFFWIMCKLGMVPRSFYDKYTK